ncbi:MAG: DUF58 domain-containing protein [Paludibacteraceae bacterium]|nr:DUF58 domain-containing protein [Paludibacteraceae bacterium]
MKTTSELLKKIRKIEIKARGLSTEIFAGEYRTAFKGRGMTFAEVRDYQPGDDIRNIDWNVTARFNRPYVKVFEEEREMTVMLMVDVSASGDFGSCDETKREIMTEIAATIAFSAIQNNDKIGMIFFSDKVEKFISPQKGSKHILYLIREMLTFQPESRATNISCALRYFTNAIKRHCSAFIISDFLGPKFVDDLIIANRKHDCATIRIYDPREVSIPDVGLICMRDAETGEDCWVDTSSKSVRDAYKAYWQQKSLEIQQSFHKAGVDSAVIATDQDFVKGLVKMFHERALRH